MSELFLCIWLWFAPLDYTFASPVTILDQNPYISRICFMRHDEILLNLNEHSIFWERPTAIYRVNGKQLIKMEIIEKTKETKREVVEQTIVGYALDVEIE